MTEELNDFPNQVLNNPSPQVVKAIVEDIKNSSNQIEMTPQTPSNSSTDLRKSKRQKKTKPVFKVPLLCNDVDKDNNKKGDQRILRSALKHKSTESQPNDFNVTKTSDQQSLTKDLKIKRSKTIHSEPTPKSQVEGNEEGKESNESKEKKSPMKGSKTSRTKQEAKGRCEKAPVNQPRCEESNRQRNTVSEEVPSRTIYSAALTVPDISRFHPQSTHDLNKPSTSTFSFENDEKKWEKTTSAALSKMNFDSISINPNADDKFKKEWKRVAKAGTTADEANRQAKEENLVVARQCRLHPSNRSLNQGAIENPPLMSPALMVGYTPAGQRYEGDLNTGRPTWFNSEYARRQFDDATKINACRMFSDIETGNFLPASLDPNIERRHIEEKKLSTKCAVEYFEQSEAIIMDCSANVTSEQTFLDHEKLLDTEMTLIDLNEFALVRMMDFPLQLKKKLEEAMKLDMTCLMFIKNPMILQTFEKISRQNIFQDLIKPAQDLLMKIKSLFDVPEDKTFDEFFTSQVEMFRENTSELSAVEIMLLVDEPSPSSSTDNKSGSEETTNENHPFSAEIGSAAFENITTLNENLSITSPHESSSTTGHHNTDQTTATTAIEPNVSQPSDSSNTANEDNRNIWVPIINPPNGRSEHEIDSRPRNTNTEFMTTAVEMARQGGDDVTTEQLQAVDHWELSSILARIERAEAVIAGLGAIYDEPLGNDDDSNVENTINGTMIIGYPSITILLTIYLYI